MPYFKVTCELTSILECFPLSDSSSFHPLRDVWTTTKKSTVRLNVQAIIPMDRTPVVPYCFNLSMYVVLYVCLPFTTGVGDWIRGVELEIVECRQLLGGVVIVEILAAVVAQQVIGSHSWVFLDKFGDLGVLV